MIKEKRIELGMSQVLLAEKVGVSQNSISNYESGLRKPRWSIAIKLSKILEVSLEEIVNERGDRVCGQGD